MEFKEKTPRSSWKSLFQFFKKLNFFHIFLVFLHKKCYTLSQMLIERQGSTLPYAPSVVFHFFCGIMCGLTLAPLTKRKKMACYAIQQPPTAERLLTFVHFPPCPHIPYHLAFGIWESGSFWGSVPENLEFIFLLWPKVMPQVFTFVSKLPLS